jgi:mRNA-degrading endonuclease RelE of RelBE toxin-antitoxin system
MKVEYLPSFLKNLKALKSSPVYNSIFTLVFEEIPKTQSLQDISQVKKLKGSSSAYRIRVGDYRIGFFFENETIKFACVLHRKEIYRSFP